MKRWQILTTVVAMVAVGLAGYAVGASRQPTDIAVESPLASAALAARVIPGHDDNYHPGGAPNYVAPARKEQPDYSGYNPRTAQFDPWILGFETTDSAAVSLQGLPNDYNPLTDAFDPWLY
jgi:hypothetical protein